MQKCLPMIKEDFCEYTVVDSHQVLNVVFELIDPSNDPKSFKKMRDVLILLSFLVANHSIRDCFEKTAKIKIYLYRMVRNLSELEQKDIKGVNITERNRVINPLLYLFQEVFLTLSMR